MMNRRTFALGLAAAPFGCLCLGQAHAGQSGGDAVESAGATAQTSGPAQWGYQGAEGPENWGTLSQDYAVCGSGRMQSPIDVASAAPSDLASLNFNYGAASLDLVNNGHTLQANIAPGNRLSVGARSFELLQFHFHTPSEHQVLGSSFPMEVHFVHKSESGELAVVAVLLEEGAENYFLSSFIDVLPQSAGGHYNDMLTSLFLGSFFPLNRQFVRYFGSLTKPPCSEWVNWYVMTTPVQASGRQIEVFKRIMGNNARPAQPLNERLLLLSG